VAPKCRTATFHKTWSKICRETDPWWPVEHVSEKLPTPGACGTVAIEDWTGAASPLQVALGACKTVDMKDELLDTEVMAVARGERPYTWDVWASGVEDAEVLTKRGRTEVKAMIVDMATFLGEDGLPNAYTSYR
jgi:hypothetical protein